MLLYVVHVVGRSQDLGLVNVIHSQGFEDLTFDEVSNTGFGHYGDCHGGHDLFYQFWVRHSGYAALGADVGWDSFEGHDGAGAGFFGDACL